MEEDTPTAQTNTTTGWVNPYSIGKNGKLVINSTNADELNSALDIGSTDGGASKRWFSWDFQYDPKSGSFINKDLYGDGTTMTIDEANLRAKTFSMNKDMSSLNKIDFDMKYGKGSYDSMISKQKADAASASSTWEGVKTAIAGLGLAKDLYFAWDAKKRQDRYDTRATKLDNAKMNRAKRFAKNVGGYSGFEKE